MSRKYNAQHIVAAGFEHVALCGFESTLMNRASDPMKTNCPKCSAKYFGKLIEGRCEIVKCDNPRDKGRSYFQYRSQYELRVDGRLRGYVTCENGWGKGWTIRDADNDRDDGHIKIAYAAHTMPGDQHRQHSTFDSKEHAAFVALAEIAKNPKFMPEPMTPEAYLAEEAAHNERQRTAKERRRVESIASSEEMIAATAASVNALEKHQATLRGMNPERDDVADAIRVAVDLIEKRIADERGRIATAQAYMERVKKGGDF